jgi:exonuclease III
MGFTDVYRALNPDARAYTWWYVSIGGRNNLLSTGLGRRIDYFIINSECIKWVKRCEILR